MKRAAIAGGVIAVISVAAYGIVQAGWWINAAPTQPAKLASAEPGAPAAAAPQSATVAPAQTFAVRPVEPTTGTVSAAAPAPVAASSPAQATAQRQAACANPNSMGVARVVEIDTAGGPGFGLQRGRAK
jgi:hypothetical protein